MLCCVIVTDITNCHGGDEHNSISSFAVNIVLAIHNNKMTCYIINC